MLLLQTNKFNKYEFYRVMKEPVEKLKRIEWYYSNPNPSFMRFNRPNERMLYISNCPNVCFYESKIKEGEEISLIKYKSKKGLKIKSYGKDNYNDKYKSYLEFISEFYRRLVFREDLNKFPIEQYYDIINDIKDYFDCGREHKEEHGYSKVSITTPCPNKKCSNLSIGIKEEYEREFLTPYSVTTFDMKIVNGEKKYEELETYLVEELLK